MLKLVGSAKRASKRRVVRRLIIQCWPAVLGKCHTACQPSTALIWPIRRFTSSVNTPCNRLTVPFNCNCSVRRRCEPKIPRCCAVRSALAWRRTSRGRCVLHRQECALLQGLVRVAGESTGLVSCHSYHSVRITKCVPKKAFA